MAEGSKLQEFQFKKVSVVQLEPTSASAGKPLEIGKLYKDSYQEKRKVWCEKGIASWLVYQFLVQGKKLQKLAEERRKEGDDAITIVDNLTLCIMFAPPRNCWTAKRISACMLLDNGRNTAAGEVDPPEKITASDKNGPKKYLPALSSVVPYKAIAERVEDANLKKFMVESMPYFTGPGLNFLWRLMQETGSPAAHEGVAIAITAFFLDLAAINAVRSKDNLRPYTAREAKRFIIDKQGGTFAGLVANSSGTDQEIAKMSQLAWAKPVMNSDLTTTFGGSNKVKVAAALKVMYGDDLMEGPSVRLEGTDV